MVFKKSQVLFSYKGFFKSAHKCMFFGFGFGDGIWFNVIALWFKIGIFYSMVPLLLYILNIPHLIIIIH